MLAIYNQLFHSFCTRIGNQSTATHFLKQPGPKLGLESCQDQPMWHLLQLPMRAEMYAEVHWVARNNITEFSIEVIGKRGTESGDSSSTQPYYTA